MKQCTCASPCGGTQWNCPSNPEYEVPLSNNKSYQKHIYETNLESFDQKLAELDRATKAVQEQRREYVNRNNLNKTYDGYTKG